MTIKEALLLSEDERKIMGTNGRQFILENFMVDKVAKMMKDVYSWILNGTNMPLSVYTS